MKNSKKIHYLEIKKRLISNGINPISDISDSDFFTSLNSLSNASNTDLTFFADMSQIDILKKTKAKACLINSNHLEFLPNCTKSIIVDNTYESFAILSNLFNLIYKSNGIIAKYTIVSEESSIDENVQIDAFSVIREGCIIGKNVIIESNCSIGPNVNIGSNSIIQSNTNIREARLGKNCIIKSGCDIGSSGFGFDPRSKERINHIGNVIIEDNCNIGSNTSIDRAVFDSTIISENSFIDNLVQIAHNVTIGKGAIIAAQTGIAGSTKIGDNVIIGGQVGISGHLTIGSDVKIAAKSGVTKNINNSSTVAGFPAVDIKKWKLSNIKLNKLK